MLVNLSATELYPPAFCMSFLCGFWVLFSNLLVCIHLPDVQEKHVSSLEVTKQVPCFHERSYLETVLLIFQCYAKSLSGALHACYYACIGNSFLASALGSRQFHYPHLMKTLRFSEGK